MSFIHTITKDIKFCFTCPENTKIEIKSEKCSCIFFTWSPYKNNITSPVPRSHFKSGIYLKYKFNEQDKILLVQTRENFWGFPKGALKKGETIKDAACREVEEETSLKFSLSNEPVYRIFNTIFFVKNIPEPITINIDNITCIHNNNCSGIAMVEKTCLKHKRHNINLNMITKTIINSNI